MSLRKHHQNPLRKIDFFKLEISHFWQSSQKKQKYEPK
ncbi:hypothetical protein Anacy_5403 [Anabaena cylindrica PCC 7122]|uniref:Uncharacterized protein n=1 Tax=Anabaena cylindrica (strain ATCC 27899 / PCC 7122) TaxID=272123 RepID=K9ZNF6_ANACC|nr:hypothetical protein Anacy_5403 [Anabaena cylindrica PCC 7122]BAY02192.1 hypothetical protein NIES19_14330 [Anabaena cylindrica PCC 7122]